MPAGKFVFTEAMIREAKKKERERKKERRNKNKGRNPLPSTLESCNNHFILDSWDIWFNLVLLLKNELGRRSQLLANNRGKPLFNLVWEDKRFKLQILQAWAADSLGLPDTYTCRESKPYPAYAEIVCRYMEE